MTKKQAIDPADLEKMKQYLRDNTELSEEFINDLENRLTMFDDLEEGGMIDLETGEVSLLTNPEKKHREAIHGIFKTLSDAFLGQLKKEIRK